MSTKCEICGANIIYGSNDVTSFEGHVQVTEPKREGHLIVFPFNVYDKMEFYSITCPQCGGNVICGKKLLEENINK